MEGQLKKLMSVLKSNQERYCMSFVLDYSEIVLEVLCLLRKEGYLRNFRLIEFNNKVYFIVSLKRNCFNFRKKIRIRSLLNPKTKTFFFKRDLSKISTKSGFFLLKTFRGLFSNREVRILGIGGNSLFYIQ